MTTMRRRTRSIAVAVAIGIGLLAVLAIVRFAALTRAPSPCARRSWGSSWSSRRITGRVRPRPDGDQTADGRRGARPRRASRPSLVTSFVAV